VVLKKHTQESDNDSKAMKKAMNASKEADLDNLVNAIEGDTANGFQSESEDEESPPKKKGPKKAYPHLEHLE